MKDKEMIEEMAKDILNAYNVNKLYSQDVAKFLYEQGYRKITDSVVLSREEYIDLSRNYVGEQIAQARKETSEKIFKMLISKLDSNQFLSGKRIIMEVDVENLAKQFDVEIEG